MARMIPACPSSEVKSAAERKLFPKLRDELGGEWTILHSVGIAKHSSKPWAEIDFVLIGPQGVLCIEVKGGGVTRSAGIWEFENKHGQIAHKHESPFMQVGGGAAALRKFICSNIPSFGAALSGYAVCFPDVSFNRADPEVIQELLYDAGDYGVSFSRFVERVCKYWRHKYPSNHKLTEAECKTIVQLLRGDFDYQPSLRITARDVRERMVGLTEQQYLVLDAFPENDRILVTGGPGTGKTLLAVKEARRYAEHGVDVVYLCYNRLLSMFVKQLFKGEKCVRVTTLHSLMADLIREASLASQLPSAHESDLYEQFIPEVAMESLLRLGEAFRAKNLIVDEGQDLLLDSYLSFLDLYLSGGWKGGRWRFFYDRKQAIFGADPSQLSKLQSGHPAKFPLTRNCRNTKPIAVYTSLLSTLDMDPSTNDGPPPRMFFYSHGEDLFQKLSQEIQKLLSQGVPPEEIVILSPNKLSPSDLSRTKGLAQVRLLECDETPKGFIGLSTIQSFKGLERDFVFLIGIEDLETRNGSLLAYVGASRSRVLLTVFISETERHQYNSLAESFGRRAAAANG